MGNTHFGLMATTERIDINDNDEDTNDENTGLDGPFGCLGSFDNDRCIPGASPRCLWIQSVVFFAFVVVRGNRTQDSGGRGGLQPMEDLLASTRTDAQRQGSGL